jgi:hypothetical protein
MASVVPLVERRHMAERGVALELGIPAPPGSAPFRHGGALPSIESFCVSIQSRQRRATALTPL